MEKIFEHPLVALGVEKLAAAFKKGSISKGGTCSICVVHSNEHCYIPNSQGCFGSTSHNAVTSTKNKREFLIIGIQKFKKSFYDASPEESIAYYDYLMNRSPMQDAFASKDAAECLEKGCVVMSVHCPSNLMMCGMFAARHQWEKPIHIKTFLAMRDAGVQENLAFFLTQCLSFQTDEENILLHMGTYSSGHQTFHPSGFRLSDVRNFIRGEPQKPNSSYQISTSYTGIDALFVKPGSWDNDSPKGVSHFIRTNYIPGGVDSTKNNPFYKAVVKKGKPTYEPFDVCIKGVVEFSQGLMTAIESA